MVLHPLLLLSLLAAPATEVAAMRWEKRVLLVRASGANDPSLLAQRRILQRWRAGAAERDLVLVEVQGETVVGASDTPAQLRRRVAGTHHRLALHFDEHEIPLGRTGAPALENPALGQQRRVVRTGCADEQHALLPPHRGNLGGGGRQQRQEEKRVQHHQAPQRACPIDVSLPGRSAYFASAVSTLR